MREYELTVVFDLSVAEAGGADAAPNHVDTIIAARGGTVLKHDHWGRRRMAYPINRAIDADYVVSRVELDPTQVTPLEAAMRIDERIYRHLIVRADELPIPPPPREPRRIPGEATDGQPEEAVVGAAEGAATEPVATTVEAEPEAAEAAEPVAAAVEAEPDTAEAVEPPEDAEPATAESQAVDEPAVEAAAPEDEPESAIDNQPAAIDNAPTETEAAAEAGTEDEAPSA